MKNMRFRNRGHESGIMGSVKRMCKFVLFHSLQVGFLSFVVLSCDSPSINSDLEVEKIIPSGDERYLIGSPEYIFNQEILHTFELNIPESSLAKIDADPSAEEYIEGSLTFEGETISPVGIRYKGSIGAYVNCLSDPNWAEPKGYKVCTKLSMKVKVNWEDKDNKFYGLKKLQFHSQNLDPTQMHERLGYWLFREMGVPAPRSVHARLVINGTYSGIYALTEQIDGRFTRDRFSDGTGNLYKEIWPVDMNGQPYAEQTYLNHLKTNEDENPTAQLIRTFAQEISDSDSDGIRNVISKWMDIEKIMAFAVVDRTIGVDDGPFHWYCGNGNCSNHNYYWYEDPSESRLHLIPWDLDNAFENLIEDANPVTPIADDWGNITSDCKPFNYGWLQISQRSAACDKLTAGWVSFENEFQQTLTQFLQGPFSESRVNSLLDSWEEQIRTATVEASQTHEDAISMSEWEEALDRLKAGLSNARNN